MFIKRLSVPILKNLKNSYLEANGRILCLLDSAHDIDTGVYDIHLTIKYQIIPERDSILAK